MSLRATEGREEIPWLLGACFLAFLLGSLTLGCRREESIQTYRVSKDTAPTQPLRTKDIEWTTPAGWKEQPATAMRLGSFLITGANGQTADVSVVPLSGMAGGDLANINRWRGQIQLEPLSEADLTHQSQIITPGGRTMRWVDFVSREPQIAPRHKKRVVAAIYTEGQRSWFFKMIGEDQTVETAKPAFLRFLQTLRFHDSR